METIPYPFLLNKTIEITGFFSYTNKWKTSCGEGNMGRLKKLCGAAVLLLAILGVFFIFYYFRTWPLRFRQQLNHFFGKGNWEQISSVEKESIIYDVYYRSYGRISSGNRPGTFTEWDILYTDENGRQGIWTLSDHTMRINHDRHWFLSSERYSAKEAFTLELMDLSTKLAGEQVRLEILQPILSEPEAQCLDVSISYRGGNPPPQMYGQLLKESWFTAGGADAKAYLETELYDFYIRVLAYDYRVEKLTDSQQTHLENSLGAMEEALKEAYGEYADYDIYLGPDCEAVFSGKLARPAASY